MRNLILTLVVLFSTTTFAGNTNRILEGATIKNGAGVLTLPTSTDTVVGRATTDTLTNKTISGASNTITNVSLTSGVTGTLPIANGGTGQTGANAAFNALAPSQATHSGKFLTTDGTDTSWATIPATSPNVVDTRASPTAITAGGGVSFAGTNYNNINFIQGSGGAVDVTANPQVAAATNVGQKLTLIGRSATNTVLLEDGTGLSLNGQWLGGLDSVLNLVWDGTAWLEVSRQ